VISQDPFSLKFVELVPILPDNIHFTIDILIFT